MRKKMARLKHKPGHHKADANGWVTEDDWNEYPYIGFYDDSKYYTEGNQKKSVGYIADEMEPTRHMASGRYFTSKHKFREETRAYGCIEVGNETKTLLQKRKPIQLDKRQRVDDIKRSIYELKNGRKV